MLKQKKLAYANLLPYLVLVAILGFFVLAFLDNNYRNDFARLTEILVSGYIGSLMPRNP